MRGVHVPSCRDDWRREDKDDGGYESKQCQDGLCWCVDEAGKTIKGTLTKGRLECYEQGYYKEHKSHLSLGGKQNLKTLYKQVKCSAHC